MEKEEENAAIEAELGQEEDEMNQEFEQAFGHSR